MACLMLVLAAGFTTAGEGKGQWVSKSGNVHAIHGNAVFVSDEDAVRFDLNDLRDGETRTFGTGARAVTVRRSGNEATISRSGSGSGVDDVSAIDITCRLDEHTCTVLTFPDEPEKVMVAIEKERTCINGVGDCDIAFGEGHGEGHVIVDIECEGDDCADLHTLHLDALAELDHSIEVESIGEGDEAAKIVIRRVGGEGVGGDNVFVTKNGTMSIGGLQELRALHGDRVMLRCTEDDATIMVKKEEKDDTFLCPKHSTPMEPVKGHGELHVIRPGKPHDH